MGNSFDQVFRGNAGNAGGAGLDVAEVFSTYLYEGTGTNAAQTTITVNNGIDLSGEGGLVWVKARTNPGTNSNNSYYSSGAGANMITDSESGITKQLSTNNTNAGINFGSGGATFNNSGFVVGYNGYTDWNYDGYKYSSWTFRKAPKFFDVVTYTGDGASGRLIDHNLGSAPGMVVIKSTSTSGTYWSTYHRGLSANNYILLNESNAQAANGFTRTVSSTQYELGPNWADENQNNRTYVAYFFAHNDGDGGFGPDADQDIISCGSFSSAANSINLGWEPQWILMKKINSSHVWYITDNMRGLTSSTIPTNTLYPSLNNVEGAGNGTVFITSTGFDVDTTSSGNYVSSGDTIIYMAIRAPMITPPAAATEVFAPSLVTATQANQTISTGFAPDAIVNFVRSNANYGQQIISKLTGADNNLYTNYNSAESAFTAGTVVLNNTGFSLGPDNSAKGWNRYTNYTSVKLSFKRAKGYMDVVAYTGTGGAGTHAHSLGVAPEMMWVKRRDGTGQWSVFHSGLGEGYYLRIAPYGTDAGAANTQFWNNTDPTSSVFSVGNGDTNGSGQQFIAYLFATLDGISKLGSVSHSGSSTDVDCGFSNGARFVLLKRTDAAGDWYAWNSATGIVSGNDPYMLFNSAAAEVTNTDYIDPLSSGFQISGDFTDGDYIFYAIA